MRPYENMDQLTNTEQEILGLVLQGNSTKEIARARGTSLNTTATQLRSILEKCGCRSRLKLATKILNKRIEDLEELVEALVGGCNV